MSQKVIHTNVENDGQPDPKRTPEQRGLNFHDRIFFMKHKQVKAEHNHDKDNETNPKSNTYHTSLRKNTV
jgi:hypothetical protein